MHRLIPLLAAVLSAFLLGSCTALTTSTNSFLPESFSLSEFHFPFSDIRKDSESASEPDSKPDSEEEVSDDIFEVEYVGYSSQYNFHFYRETTTDLILVRTGQAGLIVLPDPETGRPLTYTEYLALGEGSKKS